MYILVAYTSVLRTWVELKVTSGVENGEQMGRVENGYIFEIPALKGDCQLLVVCGMGWVVSNSF